MATTRRSRTFPIDPDAIWSVIEDPHHLPRWWPGVKRVEGVGEDRFTQVLYTKRGRPVRVDFQRTAADPPRRLEWSQEIAGTPFERVLRASVTEVMIEARPDGVTVTIEQRQDLRGTSKMGGIMLRRATRRRLDEALDGLAQIFG